MKRKKEHRMGERSSHTREQVRGRQVIKAYVDVATEVLPQYFSADCCLNGTRVAIEALAAYGVRGAPTPCRMLVANKIASDFLAGANGEDPPAETLDAWKAAGAWMIAIDGAIDPVIAKEGYATITEGYGRHLVCIAAGMLVDSAFGQFNRPQHDILTPPVCAGPVGSSFRERFQQFVQCDNGSFALYMVDHEDLSYEELPGFQRSPHNLKVAIEVIAKMSEVLR